MGCDIHCYVERLNHLDVWEPVYGVLTPCGECDGSTRVNPHCDACKADVDSHDEVTQRCFVNLSTFRFADEPCPRCTKDWAPPGKEERWDSTPYHGRNYELFGVLADVRGRPDDDFTQAERGIPDDASENYRNVAGEPDWHSHTYYTLKELKKFPWKKKFPHFAEAVEKLETMEPDPERIRLLMFFDN